MGGRGALIKAPTDLPDLRRGIYAGGKAGSGGTGGVGGAPRRKHCRGGRSHNPRREAGRRAECGKSARSVRRGGGWRRGQGSRTEAPGESRGTATGPYAVALFLRFSAAR